MTQYTLPPVLTEQEVINEVDRILDVVSWAKSPEGVDLHTVNHADTSLYSVVAGMLEHMINDAEETRGYNPVYILSNLVLRIRGQYPEYRDDFDKVFNLKMLLDGELSWSLRDENPNNRNITQIKEDSDA